MLCKTEARRKIAEAVKLELADGTLNSRRRGGEEGTPVIFGISGRYGEGLGGGGVTTWGGGVGGGETLV